MPEVLDFLLAFGISENAKDFNYTGFRSALVLDDDMNRLDLPEMDRSGRELRLCHILRSVEQAEPAGRSEKAWRWNLRPTVTYHSYDIETEKSVWLIVKANGLIKGRVRANCKDKRLYQLTGDGSNNAFESTLSTHLVLCAWAGENWRWYINYMEEKAQALTRGTLTESMPRYPVNGGSPPDPRFSFDDLQDVHFVEEKANEALLVVRGNITVMQDLRTFYSEAVEAMAVAPKCNKPSLSAVCEFNRYVRITIKELTTQEARLQMLLRLLADRRALVSAI